MHSLAVVMMMMLLSSKPFASAFFVAVGPSGPASRTALRLSTASAAARTPLAGSDFESTCGSAAQISANLGLYKSHVSDRRGDPSSLDPLEGLSKERTRLIKERDAALQRVNALSKEIGKAMKGGGRRRMWRPSRHLWRRQRRR